METHRCAWVTPDPLYVRYHDTEWGVPVHDERTLFEFLTLESFQAGLSWLTVLRKRENFRQAFANFDPAVVAQFGEREMAALQEDAGIIRNRQKIRAAVINARAFLGVQEAFGSFDRYVWQFVDGAPVQNQWRHRSEIPATTPIAEALSKDLKRRGFCFVGPTVCYAHMQATGMVNDHTLDCFRHREVRELPLG
ncbi:MAG TPA: DNA-3-methyladenine glycosylase I [Trueperaceae bacterium]